MLMLRVLICISSPCVCVWCMLMVCLFYHILFFVCISSALSLYLVSLCGYDVSLMYADLEHIVRIIFECVGRR